MNIALACYLGEGGRVMLHLSRRLSLLVLLLLALTLLIGCGSAATKGVAPPSATPHAAPASTATIPTSLRVVRLSAFPEKHVAAFTAQTQDAEKVQRLFATLQALPRFVPQFSCPVDHGGAYFLTFLEQDKIVAEGVIPAGDCSQVSLSKPYGCHTPSATTMNQIAATLGAPQSELSFAPFMKSAPSGSPTAPADPPDPLLSFSACY